MALDPNELEMIMDMQTMIARIDERTGRMDEEYIRKFNAVHKRIDDVRADAKGAGMRAGGTIGGIIAAGMAALGAYFGFK